MKFTSKDDFMDDLINWVNDSQEAEGLDSESSLYEKKELYIRMTLWNELDREPTQEEIDDTYEVIENLK